MTTDTPEGIRRLVAELDALDRFDPLLIVEAVLTLRRYARSLETAARKQDGTHSTECWRWHHDCAIARIEAAQRALRGSE